MKTPIDSTIISAISSIVEGTKNDVTYDVSKDEIIPTFMFRTWFERLFGFELNRDIIRRTYIKITIIEKC